MHVEVILLLIVASLTAIFSLMVFRGSRERLNITFVFFVISASAWPLGIALFWLSNSLENALYFANFYYLAAAFIPILFLRFCQLFSASKEISSVQHFLQYTPGFLLFILMLLNENIMIGEIYYIDWRKGYDIERITYAIYALTFIIYVLYSFKILFTTYLRETTKTRSKQLLFIISGTLFPFMLGMVYNLILPWFDNFNYIWLGPVFSLIMVISIGYAIARHHLFDLKVIATETLLLLLWIFLLIRTILSENSADFMVNIIILAFTFTAGVLLIRAVIREVRTRERIEQLARDLAIANERLKQLDQQKSEFLSIASHQLRSPLTAIKGYASMLLEGSFGKIEHKAQEAVERIAVACERLVIIVEDFLNVSRIEQGRMKYEFGTVNMTDLVQNVVAELQSTADNAKLELSASVEPGEYFTVADSGKIKQVLINVLDNAIKYTQKGWVKLSMKKNPEAGEILIEISDSGIGIKSEVMPQIFKKFQRAEKSNNINIQGTGLGLYVAKVLLEAHKGRITAHSRGEGKGSTFRIYIPAK